MSLMIGAAAAIGSFLVVIGVVVLICRKWKTKRKVFRRSVTEKEEEESKSFDPSLAKSEISMEKIRSATANFSSELIVGDGSFGMVYRAELACGRTVAVKRLDQDAFQGVREFRAEIETLGMLQHPNLARILGFCVTGADRILVYDFVERGNLDAWLHHDDDTAARLPWTTRLSVAYGVAKGLEYLHGLANQVIHRDIKASNVLLDASFGARIADFGLARTVSGSRSHVSTQAAGTMGYMPPEYKEGYTVATVHADVYSFGVLMLEIATARRPNHPFSSDDVALVQWARRMTDAGRHLDMMDPHMPDPQPSSDQAAHYMRLACLCASDLKRHRPSMNQVLQHLSSLTLSL